MPGVPFFVPAPVVDERGYNPFARRASSSSIPKRPSSAKSTGSYRPSSRPSSAKPARPQSAKQPSAANKDVDYMGVSNMMKSLNFKKTRKWQEKSPEEVEGKSQNPEPPKRRVVAWKDKEEDSKTKKPDKGSISSLHSDINVTRRHRSSHYAKFKYPQQYHYGSSLARASYIERNIPQCLRRGARYGNQPLRQNCNFNPPNGVTHLKWHSIKSGALPAYKGPSVLRSSSTTPSESRNGDDTADEVKDDDLWSDGPNNGTFEYVYKGKDSDSQIFFDVDDAEEYADSMNNNQTPREAVISVLNSEGESDAESIADDLDNGPQSVLAAPAEEIPEEVEDELKEWTKPVKAEKTGLLKSSISRHAAPAEEVPEEVEDEPQEWTKQAKAEETGLFKSSVSRDSDRESIMSYNEHVNVDNESDAAESIKSSKSAHSIKSSKSAQSIKSNTSQKSAASSKSSRKASRKSSQASSDIKYGDSDINDILGSDNSYDPVDEFMSSARTPPVDETRSGKRTPSSPSNGRFSRTDASPVTRDSKFRKTVRIQDPVKDESDFDVPEDDTVLSEEEEEAFSMGGSSLGSLPPFSMLSSNGGQPETPRGRPRRVNRPLTAVRRNLEEDHGDF